MSSESISIETYNIDDAGVKSNRIHLFLVGFLILFLELACIRWFSAYVIFLQFFTNIVLIAAFLGMSIGCVCARKQTDWLSRFTWLTPITIGLALGVNAIYRSFAGFSIDVGGQRESPQVVFFGTEYRDVDIATFAIPMEVIAGLFFVLIVLMFIGPGQILGRCFDRDPSRVKAYTMNIAGSLAGILCFALSSFAQTPPVVWFAIAFAAVAYFLKQEGTLSLVKSALLAATAFLIFAVGFSPTEGYSSYWSPYYRVILDENSKRINVNTVSHQSMREVDKSGPIYSLIHLLERDSGGEPFENVLVIGAGSGNDVAGALRQGVGRVDAVEIDPVIAGIGQQLHPARPYQDGRVDLHLNDGRNFLRETDRKYDLVVYALVDSLILHSSVSHLRLESFLFTEEAFEDVRRVLKPGGKFVAYNFFRQGWIVHRIAAMLNSAFDADPIVTSLKHKDQIRDTDTAQGFTVLIAGGNETLANAFAENEAFWLHREPRMNDDVNGFGEAPPQLANAGSPNDWLRIAPSTLVASSKEVGAASDNWPFLYMRDRTVPWFYIKGVLLMTVLGLAVLYWQAPGHRISMNGRMFFLGAAFLLVETKAVVQLALVFGSTWIVNSLVFAAILIMILAANLYVLRVKEVNLKWHYALLFATLAVHIFVPLDAFLAGNFLWRYVGPCILALGPMFFAGVIFAVSFRASKEPDRDFGANIAGAVVGGFAEYLSMLLGFQYLLLVAILFYALSTLWRTGGSIASFSNR
jgi:SAM-dependent methyltransferase